MALATLTNKGQVTIPKAVRVSLGLHTGDKLEFVIAERGKHSLQADALLEPPGRIARRFERLCHAAHAETTNQVIGTELSWLTCHPLGD